MRASRRRGCPLARPVHDVAEEVAATGASERFALVLADIQLPEASEQIIEAARSHFGGVDALVNNASSNAAARYSDRIYDVPVEEWKSVMETNVNGPSTSRGWSHHCWRSAVGAGSSTR